MEKISKKNEDVIIVGLKTPDEILQQFEESIDELKFLVESAGGNVIETFTQSMKTPKPATFIGSGKLGEIATYAKEQDCHTIVFDNDLKPNQIRNIESIFGDDIKIIDRSGLILDIFATHARTAESRVQVELAQLEYLRPRLTGLWGHLSRQYGGSIGARGPGEKQLESDRRAMDMRITKLKDKLDKLEKQRKTRRRSRRNLYRIALLGYTNAGKTTLLNVLTNAGAYARNQLFATLDPKTRIFSDAWGRKVLLTDTVGFIRKLPHHLVESFRSTLAEAEEADQLLIIADAQHPALKQHLNVVESELKRIGISKTKKSIVLNKIDKLDNLAKAELMRTYPDAYQISALSGEGMEELREEILKDIPRGFKTPPYKSLSGQDEEE